MTTRVRRSTVYDSLRKLWKCFRFQLYFTLYIKSNTSHITFIYFICHIRSDHIYIYIDRERDLCIYMNIFHMSYIYISCIHEVYKWCKDNMSRHHAYHTSMLALFGGKTNGHLLLFCKMLQHHPLQQVKTQYIMQNQVQICWNTSVDIYIR